MQTIDSIAIRDTNEHEFSVLVPDPQTDVIIEVVNNTNEPCSVDFRATRSNDPDFSEAEELASDNSVPAGETRHYTDTEPWERIGAFVTFSPTAPTSGTVDVYLVG